MCLGTGSPTVVLDAGLGADSSVWNSVLLKVREFTRVCAYDRAGLGESDPAPKKPRTSQDMVRTYIPCLPIQIALLHMCS